MKNKEVLILGAGALGSNLTARLVSDLRNEIDITVLDHDVVEERNVQPGTQFFMPEQIGMKKTHALQYNIYKWFGKEINFIDKKIFKHNIQSTMGFFGLVIDCFDNFESRTAVQLYRPVTTILHCGFSDKLTFEICWAENYEVPEDNPNARDICELPGASSFINLASSVASIAVSEFIKNGTKRNFIGNRFSVREMI